MKALLWSRSSLIWGVLTVATLLSWQLGHGPGFGGPVATGCAILTITFVKVRLVVMEFMELRHAPRWLRALFEVWIILVWVLLLILFVRVPA